MGKKDTLTPQQATHPDSHNDLACLSLVDIPMAMTDHAAVAFDGAQITRGAQFSLDVARLTSVLRGFDELRWALCFSDSYWFTVAFMAACHGGKQLVLPGNYQAGALTALSPHFDALLTDKSATSVIAEVTSITRGPVLHLPDNLGDKLARLTSLTPDNITLTLFTSGSSGPQKAINKHLGLLQREIQELQHQWGAKLNGCSVVSTVSHQHIYGLLFRILWPLCAGMPFARDDLTNPMQVMAAAAPDVCLVSSPALLKRLGNESATRTYCKIFSSGGPLPHQAAADCLSLFGLFPTEIFGSTETGGIAFRQQDSELTPWRLFPDHAIKLDADGCIMLRSAFVHPNDCRDGWYLTSDCAEQLDEHHFCLQGRCDRIVKIEEKRISLAEVEHHLCSLNWLTDAAALPLDDGQRLSVAAVICLSKNGKTELNRLGKAQFNLALRSQLRHYLEPVGIPRRFRILAQIPMNSQGKRQYQTLHQLFAAATDDQQHGKQ
ncbi:MAG: AMP-binding protein [Shewanella sp.]|nr:AMP-binding protein [Shewanella sp.]MCF1438363.1 AMP-binding protein [Shewanella sp.]